MAQDITWLDNQYENVPFVELPKTGGGNALFTDVSPTTAVDADVASGKIYFKADGSQSTGTGSGGGVDVESLSVTQNGTYTAPTGKAYSPVVVNVSGGGGSVEEKQVNFIDYDGTLIATKTKAEINAMASDSELPANPSHTGLVAQGWNWTVAQLKGQLTAMPNTSVTVGQMYTTTSGATEIDVEFTDPNRMSPYMSLAVNGEISIDWGDDSEATTVTGTSLTTRKAVGPHAYPAVGSYTIKITVTSGSWGFYGTTTYSLLYKSSSIDRNRVYASCVKDIRIGAGCTSFGQYSFYYCLSLANITMPNSVTSIGSNAFQYCYSLASITIPSGVTSIGSNAFQSCSSLASITIPSSVTSIATKAFTNCYGLGAIHFKGSTPPTVGASDAFSEVPTDCIIYVPTGTLSDYTSASNYPSSSTYTYVEE